MKQASDPPPIEAPAEVAEGTTGPIEVTAAGTSEVTVQVSSTGEILYLKVDANGRARFELPNGATAGTIITIVNSTKPSAFTTMAVVPASSS